MELNFNDYKHESNNDLSKEVKQAKAVGDLEIYRVSYWTSDEEIHRYFTEESEADEVYNIHALQITISTDNN